ncbi:alpha/beta hydrolase fold domain-containing protein [Neomicrococcus lactis]|uniref:Acetyl esterase/lipase n=1 Tax=Neomicrococcus lactis TaxID=732241 RepID=A0A7W9DB15_9MICC|nr:acetyl esterase/lipase [Neomicrococcus lactis]
MSGFPYHPELARVRFMPSIPTNKLMVKFIRSRMPRGLDPSPDVTVDEIVLSPTVSIRLFRPARFSRTIPALLWMHGGGHLFGVPEQDDRNNIAFVRELGIAVAAVRYRLGSDAPAPVSVEDCYVALKALADRDSEWGIDSERIAVGGASAGGGVAAALAFYALDQGGIQPVFQLLVYPMLDDRTVLKPEAASKYLRAWTAKANKRGWTTYTGGVPGRSGVSEYAAPARREDLFGLPPAWIGVGTLDLFRDEDIEYARRLNDAGVPCESFVVPGATHGFDQVFPDANVVKDFWQQQVNALRAALIIN